MDEEFKEDPAVEQLAADTILQRGVKFKLAAPWYIRWFKKSISVTLRCPSLGTMMQVSSHYLATGIKSHEIEEVTIEQSLALMSIHGKALSKALACALLNGRLKSWLFTKMLANYLRWHCKPSALFALVTALTIYGGAADFMNTTRSVRHMTATTPKLGQKNQGS